MNKILSAIIEHGLSIRQVPLEVVSLYTFSSGLTFENPEIVEHEVTDKSLKKHLTEKKQNDPNWRFDGEKVFRRFIRVVKIPNNAGHWMCKQVSNTSSRVEWSSKTDNLAPTLEKSVEKFLAAINK